MEILEKSLLLKYVLEILKRQHSFIVGLNESTRKDISRYKIQILTIIKNGLIRDCNL